MINKEILEKLKPANQEELDILGGKAIDASIYTDSDLRLVTKNKLLAAGKTITVRPHTRFIRFPEHTHDFVEAVYMCSGSTTHIINGKKLVLKEGELLFLGQNAKQEIYPAGENDIAINFIILPQFFNKTLEMLGAEETPIKHFILDALLNKENRGYLHFKVAEVLTIQNLVENLIWTLINDVPNRRNINQLTMGLLFMQLLNHTDKLVYETRSQKAILQVIRYIENNYKEGSLSEAAELMHYDFYWLSHEIKEQTGKTYTELLQEKRLSQAAYLLKNTGLSAEEISKAVGYENKSYFYRIFTSHYGKSPKKYRDSILKNIN